MIFIESQDELDRLVTSLRSSDWIAIDTEADSLHSYFDKVCLVQITTAAGDWIVDPLAGADVASLAPPLEDPAIEKYLHGADYDIRILDRDFGIRMRNITDTMVLAQLTGEPAIGLAALLSKYFQVELDKKYQRADWSRRPLTPEMAEYAMEDTRHLRELVLILRERISELDREKWVEEEMQRLEEIRHEPTDGAEPLWRRIKGAGKLDRRGLAILDNLTQWRDGEARRRDVPPFKVMSNDMLKTIAEVKPRSSNYLLEKTKVPERLARRYRKPILQSVHEALDRNEDDLPEWTRRDPWKPDRVTEKKVKKLKTVRDAIAKQLEIEPGILLPRHALESIVRAEARTMDEIREIASIRDWQADLLGKDLIEQLV